LTAVIGLGLLCRILLIPAEGFAYDVDTNKGWALSAAALGVGESYRTQLGDTMLPNYPPLSMLIFGGVGHAYRSLSPNGDRGTPLLHVLIKLPVIVADLLTALLFFALVRWWKRDAVAGLIAALVYVLHPAVLHDGVFWGQTDAIFSLFLVAAVTAYAAGWHGTVGALFACAALTKMQTLAVAPLFMFLGLRGGWRISARMAAGGLAAIVAVLVPYAVTGHLREAVGIYTGTVGYYAVVSSFAYNVWWALLADKAPHVGDLNILAFGLSYRTIGLTLYVFWSGLVLFWLRHKLGPGRDAVPALFLAAAMSIFSFFLWNTQMHERFLFAFVPLALPTIFIGRGSRVLYLATSVLFLFNLLGWLPATNADRWLFQTFEHLGVLIGCLLVVTFLGYMRLTWRFSLRPFLPSAGTLAASHRAGDDVAIR